MPWVWNWEQIPAIGNTYAVGVELGTTSSYWEYLCHGFGIWEQIPAMGLRMPS
jgi:hypothetical protein